MFTRWWTESSYRKSAVLMVAAAMVFTSGCSLLPKEGEEEVLPAIAPPQISKKPEYEVTTATLETKVQVIGKLISMQEETLYFTLDGKNLKELHVKPGDTVKAGDPIGSLDVDAMTKDLRMKKLAFKKEEIAMKEALRTRDEMDPVEFEEKAIAFEEKRQELSDLEEELGKATLTAPFSGTIVSLPVQKGDLIKAYAPVAIVANTSLLTPAAKLTKEELGKIAAGMPVTVSIGSGGPLKGKIRQLPMVTPAPTDNGGQPPGGPEKPERPEDFLLVDVAGLPKGLNRGTPLSIDIIVNRKENVVVIPPSTLRSIGSRTYVQVIDKDGKREVDVEVGQQTSTQIEILKGLTPGQKVVGR
ncbi:efflux RND transporter periplasmic adaptor subunit [Paenibacillus sp. GCM10023252]|uniref:efflux RND transporter periplasmic adaptor subunit n=1 Tax=Paenibacillus sp. GCM10023252 TaxID=3252649 RepID=UPI00360846B6